MAAIQGVSHDEGKGYVPQFQPKSKMHLQRGILASVTVTGNIGAP
jgi:hypothetical protein